MLQFYVGGLLQPLSTYVCIFFDFAIRAELLNAFAWNNKFLYKPLAGRLALLASLSIRQRKKIVFHATELIFSIVYI